MTETPPAGAGKTPGIARVLAASLGGAAVQALSRVWIGCLVLAWLAWVFALQIPVLLVAVEYGIAYTLLVAAHELGHVGAALYQDRRLTTVVFKPFRGAFVTSSGDPATVAAAWRSLAGPIAGTTAAFCAAVLFAITGHFALLVAALERLVSESFYLAPKWDLTFVPDGWSHDGQKVRFWLSDRGGLPSPERRRLRIGYDLTFAATLVGPVLCAVVGLPFWMWCIEQLCVLLWLWTGGQ